MGRLHLMRRRRGLRGGGASPSPSAFDAFAFEPIYHVHGFRAFNVFPDSPAPVHTFLLLGV